ncbi:hypothetical protein G9A89_012573 [Geosiphon pyriformis]|nr:hypothetical protein G9A89_012573 [Geosiphon pyriformis]
MSEPLFKKQKRAAANDALCKEICQYSKNHYGMKHDDIVAYFNHKYPELHISRPTVSKIIKEHANFKFPLLDQALSYWVEQVTAATIEFNDQLIKEKGKKFAKLLVYTKMKCNSQIDGFKNSKNETNYVFTDFMVNQEVYQLKVYQKNEEN